MRTNRLWVLGILLAATVRAEDGATPVHMLAGHDGYVLSIAFSPNGQYLASAGQDKRVRIWNSETGEPLHSLGGHRGRVRSVAFRPDSYLLASGGEYGEPGAAQTKGEVRIWIVSQGKLFRLHEFPSAVNMLAYGGKNAFAVALKDGAVEHRYTCTGNTIVSARPGSEPMCFVSIAKDNSVMASAGGNRPTLWNVSSGTSRAMSGFHSFRATCLAISPDGKTFASAGVSELRICDAQSGALLFQPQGIYGHTQAVAFTQDGATLITGGNNCHARADNGQQKVELNLWDVATGRRKGYFRGELPEIMCLAISPDGKTLATGDSKGNISLWDLSAASPVEE